MPEVHRTTDGLSTDRVSTYRFTTDRPMDELVSWLGECATPSGRIDDLRDWVVVLPGRRAGRTLLRKLSARSAAEDRVLAPPRLLTPGSLPEWLFEDDGVPVASRFIRGHAWRGALSRLERENPRALLRLYPHASEWSPADRDDVARSLERIDSDLFLAGLDFEAVTRHNGDPRFEVIAELATRVRPILDRVGLRVLDRSNTPRRFDASTNVALAGLVELPIGLARALSECGASVHAVTLDRCGDAPLDPWGRLLGAPVSPRIDADRILHTHDANEQAKWAVEILARNVAEDSATTIGIADEALSRSVVRHARGRGLVVHDARGRALDTTRPVEIVRQLGSWLDGHDWTAFSALLRIPGIAERLAREFDRPVRNVLSSTDSDAETTESERRPSTARDLLRATLKCQKALLPSTTDDLDAVRRGDDKYLARELDLARKVVRALVARTESLVDRDRPRSEWAERIGTVLADLTPDIALDPSNERDAARARELEMLRGHLETWTTIPKDADLDPPVAGVAALRELVRETRESVVPSEDSGSHADAVGFLELIWDDAEELVVLGASEGLLPGKPQIDPLLPESLRESLGLPSAAARRRRDAHLVRELSSRVSLWIAGDRNANHDRALPSRFLMQGATPEETAKRWALWDRADHRRSAPRIAPTETDGNGALHESRPILGADFRPQPLENPRSMSVTSFSSFLACPYLYYLTRITTRDDWDEIDEVDPMQFGTIAHDIVEKLVAEQGTVIDRAKLRGHVDTLVDRIRKRHFGPGTLASVPIQLEQIRARLRQFADFQAQSVRDGWKTIHLEEKFDREFVIDGEPFKVVGKIDRIDHHPEHGYRVVDYKTSESGAHPKHHRRRRDGTEVWVDLQLPLYHWLCRGRGFEGPVAVGYVPLSKSDSNVEFVPAGWSEDEIEEAITVAEEVATRVARSDYWPPSERKPDYPGPFERIHELARQQAARDAEAKNGASS